MNPLNNFKNDLFSDGKTGHSYEVDVWSLGVIIYTLFIGKVG